MNTCAVRLLTKNHSSILESTVKNITAAVLTRLIKEHAAIQLIDVREEYEHNGFNIGGLLLPLGSIAQNIDLIEKENL